MQKKFKSHSEAILAPNKAKKNDTPTAKMNDAPRKKTIVCHCWPGVYEAACRLINDYSHDELLGKKMSMSDFINIVISATHMQAFGVLPDFDNEFSKGEN